MTALPPSSDFSGGTVTQGGFKTAVNNLRDYLNGLFGSDGTVATARTALGLGTAATKNTGTSTGTVPLWETLPLNSVAAKTAAYTVVAADRGKLIDCSGTFTLSLTAAATLGNFAFAVRNSGTGTITIDPDLSEQIDGATTITLAAGESCVVVCNATAFYTVGKTATPERLSTAVGSAPSYSARAWVYFNGTGTVAIIAQGNVGSITDNGVGDYTVNFTTAMRDPFFCTAGSADPAPSAEARGTIHPTAWATGSVRVRAYGSTSTAFDSGSVSVLVMR